jgi:indole-3-glycerol phosphate synthase
MATYLDRIVARHRELTAADTRAVESLVEEAASMPATRGFRRALAGAGGLAVIGEIKRRSPSKGDLNAALDPANLAREYERGGATCLSVLTDSEFFGGSPGDLQTARAACSLPALRKDFTVSALDVADARIMGADCLLLIAAVLEPTELAELHGVAIASGLDVLVEIHDEGELDVALAAGATMVGVNQRDLTTFEVDHQRALRMAGVIPDDVIKVAESGVRGGDDARALRDAGYNAVLVGETLVTSGNPARAIGELLT